MDRKTRANLTMATICLLVSVMAFVVISTAPSGKPLNWLVRGTAMVGYVLMFCAVVSSVLLRQLIKLVGRPFLWVHHVLSVSGICLILAHPILLAIETSSLTMFVPATSSWLEFWMYAGRPALYLIVLAALAARFRRAWRVYWRSVHMLNYVAFWFATVHAVLVGTDFGQPGLRVVPILMGVAVGGLWVFKRSQMRGRRSS